MFREGRGGRELCGLFAGQKEGEAGQADSSIVD